MMSPRGSLPRELPRVTVRPDAVESLLAARESNGAVPFHDFCR